MTYRDDHEATLARNAALEAKVAELEAARDARNRPPPATSKVAEPGGEVSHAMTIVFGGMLLLAIPIIPGIARTTWTPTGTALAGVAILTLAAPALASALSRLLRPAVPIWEEHESGERYAVERSTGVRRTHVGMAAVVYAVGATLAAV